MLKNWLNDLRSVLHMRRTTPLATLPAPQALPAPRVAPSPAPATAAGDPAAATPVATTRAELVSFVEWQHGRRCRETPPGPRERRAIAHLDELIAAPQLPRDLLPRSPAVVPQLLHLMRNDTLPLSAVTAAVGKDIVLTAEVLRLAGGAYYRSRARATVTDLAEAITVLGSDGVQRAIARVVLKPMYELQPNTLAGRAAPRLWEHGDRKAASCATQAVRLGVDPFEGYLAGLLHNIGWAAAWRALDRLEGAPSLPFSQSFARRLAPRTERLFAKVALKWQITPALAELAAEVQTQGLESARSGLAQALAAAARETTIESLGPGLQAAAPVAAENMAP